MIVKLRRGKKLRRNNTANVTHKLRDWKETKSVDETVGEIKMYLLTA